MEEHLERYLKSFSSVDVVAHSMGGLLVRQYLAHHGGHNIRRLLLLSVPHFGAGAASVLAELSSVAATGNVQAQEIQPGSDFLWQLNSVAGSEFDGLDVLNAYAVSDGRSQGDMVVDPVSAWLPWAANVSVVGDHHTLPSRLDQFPFVSTFLQQGILPEKRAMKPKRRNIWIRVEGNDAVPMRFTKASVKRTSRLVKGQQVSGAFEICCDRRSSMYDRSASTVMVTDLQPGDSLLLIDRSQRPVRTIHIDLPDALEQPVTMLKKTVKSQ